MNKWRRYLLSSPTGTLVLEAHTPKEWAVAVRDHLLALGCSEAYAKRIAARIARAKEA